MDLTSLPYQSGTREFIQMIKHPYVVLPKAIKGKIRLTASKIYIVKGEVRIKSGARLTIADGCEIRIINGRFPKSELRRSALIFEAGSQLKAKHCIVKAAGADFQTEPLADNAGLWFLGTSASAQKDGLSIKRNNKTPLSSYDAQKITTHYLGRYDETKSKRSVKKISWGDDIDAISLLGLSEDEWSVSHIACHNSADDGLDLTNSRISLDRLEIIAPVEDAINLSSSELKIKKSLKLHTVSKRKDCHLFDFEVDDGPSYLVLMKQCTVDLKGRFGNQLTMSSADLPPMRGRTVKTYHYKGRIKKDPTLIFSISAD